MPRKSEDSEYGVKVQGALNRAEQLSKKLLESAEPPTQQQVTDVLLSLGDANWPTQSRPNVTPNGQPVRGMCLGLVYGLGGQGMKVSKVSETCGALTELVCRYVASSLPEADFTFSRCGPMRENTRARAREGGGVAATRVRQDEGAVRGAKAPTKAPLLLLSPTRRLVAFSSPSSRPCVPFAPSSAPGPAAAQRPGEL
jgi:hypothetical protein